MRPSLLLQEILTSFLIGLPIPLPGMGSKGSISQIGARQGDAMTQAAAAPKRATLYRMVMDKHVCPWGLKAKDLLEREGYAIDDEWLTTKEQTDAFKAKHHVATTPQTFIAGQRVGGFDDLQRYFGK